MGHGENTILEHRLDAEGADQLLLAGVNDVNLQELARIFDIRVVLRGDELVLSGELEKVEGAIPVGRHLIELSRLRVPFDSADIQRFAEESRSV
jgi:phosphate starvation-inducible protein PhoH